jgi:hypothetical protein
VDVVDIKIGVEVGVGVGVGVVVVVEVEFRVALGDVVKIEIRVGVEIGVEVNEVNYVYTCIGHSVVPGAWPQICRSGTHLHSRYRSICGTHRYHAWHASRSVDIN